MYTTLKIVVYEYEGDGNLDLAIICADDRTVAILVSSKI